MLLAELLEQRHHQLPDAIAIIPVGAARLLEQELERALVVSGLERCEHLRLLTRLPELLEQPLPAVGPNSASRKAPTPCADCTPTNSDTTWPLRNAFTAGMPLTP